MNLSNNISRLQKNADAFRGLLEGMPPEQMKWKPSADKWSAVEVINHVADEEVEDFGTRLRLLITDPALDWPPIDPPRWAVERRYIDRDLQESLERFLDARRESIEWLKSLPPQNWETSKVHPNL